MAAKVVELKFARRVYHVANIGPIIDEQSLESVDSLVPDVVEKGAKVTTGGFTGRRVLLLSADRAQSGQFRRSHSLRCSLWTLGIDCDIQNRG